MNAMPPPAADPIDLGTLAPLACWVAWQTEDRADGKPTKVPYAPDGRKARADSPRTWGTREAAEAMAAKLPKPYDAGGIGIEFTILDDGRALAGVDLDSCRDPSTAALQSWAHDVVGRMDSYTEVSPSGTGVKVFFTYTAADLPTLRANMGGAKFGKQFKRGGGDHPPAIELHLGNRYFATTGDALVGSPAEFRHVDTDVLLWLLREAGPAFVGDDEADSAIAVQEAGPKPKRTAIGGTDASRSAVAFRKGASVHRDGGTFEQMVQVLLDDPETADWTRDKGQANGARELKRIWDKAGPHESLDGFELTEDGVALAFTRAHHGLLRYCHSTGAWFQWTGKAWRKDETKLAFSWARQTCRKLVKEGGADDKERTTLAKASAAAAVERFAQSDRAFAVTASIWDADPMLLGTPSGTVDLRTGELREPVQEDYITKLTAAGPASTPECPLWLRFLDEATGGDDGLIRFLRQWCGYTLTGDTREHALLFVFGGGGNGKSILLNTVSGILGEYARIAAMETFTASQSDRHPTDLAMLRGARMVCASETEEGRAWAEVRIKQLTGGDTITARFMRQDFFEFRPAFKLTVIGNHKPVLRNVDEAARRRFNVVPFIRKPAQPDRELETKLRKEWPGILRWMIEGCLDWRLHGLVRPRVVVDATAEYFSEQDTVRQWVEDCCAVSDRPPHLVDSNGSLFGSWRNYALARGEEPGNVKRFTAALQRSGFSPLKDTDGVRGRGFRGLRVRVQTFPED